jgi:hypothetical protein
VYPFLTVASFFTIYTTISSKKPYLSKTLFFACMRTHFVQIPKIAKKFAIATVQKILQMLVQKGLNFVTQSLDFEGLKVFFC